MAHTGPHGAAEALSLTHCRHHHHHPNANVKDSWARTPPLAPPCRASGARRSAHLADRQNLAISLLHAPQLPQEVPAQEQHAPEKLVPRRLDTNDHRSLARFTRPLHAPELGLGLDAILGPDLHAVDGGDRLGLRGQVAPHHLVLVELEASLRRMVRIISLTADNPRYPPWAIPAPFSAARKGKRIDRLGCCLKLPYLGLSADTQFADGTRKGLSGCEAIACIITLGYWFPLRDEGPHPCMLFLLSSPSA